MGLDQYAFATREKVACLDAKTPQERRELAYWRKHPNLQGWMERLWEDKGRPGEHDDGDNTFNCIPVQLTKEDLDALEQAVTNGELPSTTGFFFGSGADEVYKEADLQFIKDAREALDNGETVWYDSWW